MVEILNTKKCLADSLALSCFIGVWPGSQIFMVITFRLKRLVFTLCRSKLSKISVPIL